MDYEDFIVALQSELQGAATLSYVDTVAIVKKEENVDLSKFKSYAIILIPSEPFETRTLRPNRRVERHFYADIYCILKTGKKTILTEGRSAKGVWEFAQDVQTELEINDLGAVLDVGSGSTMAEAIPLRLESPMTAGVGFTFTGRKMESL